ncbi:MAG: ferredoxin--NADP reductase [Haloarculaceae archaeon]
MQVRAHLAQHESVDDLPLLTETATVTGVTAMDHNRTEEIVAALRETLDAHGGEAWADERPDDDAACERWIRDRLDAVDHLASPRPLTEFLPEHRRDGDVGKKLDALQARYCQPYPSLLRITVDPEVPVEFVPGEYVAVRFEGTSRAYSIASAPSRDDLEFCVSRVPGGRLTSEFAVDLEAGDTVTLRGPYGELALEEPSPRDLVFLATGTGVAPLKSMIEHCFESGLDRYEGQQRDVWLFLGAPWADTLPYRDRFETLAADRENFHFVPTLSRESYLTDWDGETAYVQYALATYLDREAVDADAQPDAFRQYLDAEPRTAIDARIDPATVEVYACGLNAMVTDLVDAAERLGVPEEHTQFEGFG